MTRTTYRRMSLFALMVLAVRVHDDGKRQQVEERPLLRC